MVLGRKIKLGREMGSDDEGVCGVLNRVIGTFLAVQWLRLCASTEGGPGSIPGQEAQISHASRHGPNHTSYLRQEKNGPQRYVTSQSPDALNINLYRGKI